MILVGRWKVDCAEAKSTLQIYQLRRCCCIGPDERECCFGLGSGSRVGEKWMDLGLILEIELMLFADGLNLEGQGI